jgi:ADP-ribose pyrophosphatase YjhB (NUDIX family)
MKEYTNAGDQWIPEDEYQLICSRVPILCVDLLPIIDGTDRFGLIERDTPTGGRGLNLVGGGVLLDEPLLDAVKRHVGATLGKTAVLDVDSIFLIGVYQYYKKARPGKLHDPRKNAVSITYAGIIGGDINPAGEAYAFHEYDLYAPPPLTDFGFGQGAVVYDGLAAVQACQTNA